MSSELINMIVSGLQLLMTISLYLTSCEMARIINKHKE